MIDRSDLIDHDEETEVGHIQYLTEFDEKVWPIYQKYGYSKDTALLTWQLNAIKNAIFDVKDLLDDKVGN